MEGARGGDEGRDEDVMREKEMRMPWQITSLVTIGQVIILTSACAGITAVVALVEPIASLFANGASFLSKVTPRCLVPPSLSGLFLRF